MLLDRDEVCNKLMELLLAANGRRRVRLLKWDQIVELVVRVLGGARFASFAHHITSNDRNEKRTTVALAVRRSDGAIVVGICDKVATHKRRFGKLAVEPNVIAKGPWMMELAPWARDRPWHMEGFPIGWIDRLDQWAWSRGFVPRTTDRVAIRVDDHPGLATGSSYGWEPGLPSDGVPDGADVRPPAALPTPITGDY